MEIAQILRFRTFLEHCVRIIITSYESPSCEPLNGMLTVLTDDRTVCMNTPKYMSDGTGFFDQGDECTWFIQVPGGYRSQI